MHFVRTGLKILFNHVGALFQSTAFWTRVGHVSQKLLYWLIIWKWSTFWSLCMSTQAMLTAMTSLYIAPCKSSPPVFLITLVFYHWHSTLHHFVKYTCYRTTHFFTAVVVWGGVGGERLTPQCDNFARWSPIYADLCFFRHDSQESESSLKILDLKF